MWIYIGSLPFVGDINPFNTEQLQWTLPSIVLDQTKVVCRGGRAKGGKQSTFKTILNVTLSHFVHVQCQQTYNDTDIALFIS